MTAQQIVDQEGCLIFGDMHPVRVGEIIEWGPKEYSTRGERNTDFMPLGTKMVVIGEATFEEADAYMRRVNGMPAHPSWAHFVKVIAE